MATLGPQYWPGEMWPPPDVLGPQYWPGTEHWPPPPACFPEADICIEQAAALSASSTEPVPTESAAPATAATSSTVQLTEEQRAVLAQVGATESAYDAALRNPDDPSLVTAIEAATAEGSEARDEFISAYEAHVAEGHWTVPDPDVANSVTAIDVPVFLDDSTALVTVCHVSGDTLMGRDANGAEQVLADVRNAHLMQQIFILIDGTWRLALRSLIETFPEATSCDTEQSPASSSAPASS